MNCAGGKRVRLAELLVGCETRVFDVESVECAGPGREGRIVEIGREAMFAIVVRGRGEVVEGRVT